MIRLSCYLSGLSAASYFAVVSIAVVIIILLGVLNFLAARSVIDAVDNMFLSLPSTNTKEDSQ